MNRPSYEYRARVRRVIDGDTLDMDIDLGFEVVLASRVRLLGINTPEVVGVNKAGGLAATEFVREWLRDRVNGEVDAADLHPVADGDTATAIKRLQE